MLAPPCWAYLFSLFFNQVLLCEPLLLRKCKFRDLVCFGFCLCFFAFGHLTDPNHVLHVCCRFVTWCW